MYTDMVVIVLLIIIAVAAVILHGILKNKKDKLVNYDKNFNDGYVETPPSKPKKEERI
jgi:FtsZ-interacting cell division protein ZipA